MPIDLSNFAKETIEVNAALPTYLSAPAAPAALLNSSSRSILATFQANYAKSSGTGTVSLLDTSQPGYLGAGALKVVTPTDGSTTKVRNSVSPAVDLTGKQLRCLIWVDNPANSNDFKLFLGTDAVGTYTNFGFADLAASGSTYKPVQGGEWVWVTLTWPGDFSLSGSPTNVITNVQLQNTASNGQSTTNLWGGVWAVPQPATGYVSICFDDCWASQYTRAAPIIDTYGYPVTAAVITDLIDTQNFNNAVNGAYMSLQQMKILQSHGWEFAGHAYKVANHNAGFDTLSDPELVSELANLKQWMLTNGFNQAVDHLALPVGAYTLAQLPTFKKYFESVRTIGSLNVNSPRETFPPADWNRLRAVSVNNSNFASVASWITSAQTNKQWLILLFHDVVTSGGTGIQIDSANLTSILNSIAASSLSVRSIGDMMRTPAP